MIASGTIVRTSTSPAAPAAADTGGIGVLRGAGGRLVAGLLVSGGLLGAAGRVLAGVVGLGLVSPGLVATGARLQPAHSAASSITATRHRIPAIRSSCRKRRHT